MRNILVIPAAGKGSRLNINIPKLFIELDNYTTIYDKIIDENIINYDLCILLLSPNGKYYYEKYISHKSDKIIILVQDNNTGMLDAMNQIFNYCLELEFDFKLTVQWGDQPFCDSILHKLLLNDLNTHDISLPLIWVKNPYVQYVYNDNKLSVLESREAETVQEFGFKDMGIFSFRKEAIRHSWNSYLEKATFGKITGERNFIKYFEILAFTNTILFRFDQPYFKSIGINTIDELNEAKLFIHQQSNFIN